MIKNFDNGRRLACLLAFGMLAMFADRAAAQQIRLSGSRNQQKIDFSDRVITFKTSDGVEIEADWYPAKVEQGQRSPVAILIHMYPATRSSWKPMVPLLRDELGISVLAYDIRGTGGSVKPAEMNLQRKYEDRDAAHFAAAKNDTIAAYEWLTKQPNIDTSRMIVFGASVGCSISLDFATQGVLVKGVACLSPGTNYMGIDSLTHIKELKGRDTKVLLISPEGEYEAIESLIKATDGADYVKGRKYDGGRENHGTRMFDASYGDKVKRRLQKFARGVLDIKRKPRDDKKDDDDNDDDDKKND
ncbi:MAG TPA: alpha/beta fold hydrolase [Phycisphaerae bacterium]|nr:alpha/beta fold hydrolase [Phycisphaerae bacterium]